MGCLAIIILAAVGANAISLSKNAAGGGCLDLMCPDTSMHYGLRNLVNDDTLKTDACVSCDQCTENGYSVCLRHRDQSRATRTSHGGCSCSHQLPANCHTDTNQRTHPANITMQQFQTCFSDVIQRPPKPLAVNENSSIVVTIEPFWLEPYWRNLKVTNLKLHYKFNVKNPENCEGELETSASGVHTCVANVDVDMTDSEEKPATKNEVEDDYEHSDNYDQYDDDLPPEVQFDRDVFFGAHELETYYTAKVERSRILNVLTKKIYDLDYTTESEHLKFDLKPELYEENIAQDTPLSEKVTSTTTEKAPKKEESKKENEKEKEKVKEEEDEVIESVTESDDSATSEERGGTDFFEDEKKKESKEEAEEREDEVVVNLADIEPTKLKSQEAAKNATSVEESGEEEEGDEEEKASTTTEAGKESEDDGTTEKPESSSEENDKEEGDDEETTTTELVEGETESGADSEEESESNNETSFITRITDSFDFPRVRLVFLITLASFILFILIIICLFYRDKYCCCKSKSTKSANGYRYSSANAPPSTELNPMISRTTSVGGGGIEETEILDNFRSVIGSATTFNPNKVEIGISVGMGRFGPIYRAMFNSYNGSVHDVNIYLLKNVNRLPDDQINELTTLLKANVSAGAHPNVVSLCGVTQAGPDTMLMWEPLHQPTLQGVLRESRCARFGSEPFNFASFLSSERLATMAIGCCTGLDHLLKKNVYPSHISTSNVLVAERGIVKIGGFGLADHHALNMEHSPIKTRWQAPEHFKNQPMLIGESTIIWSLGVVLWEIFSLGGTPFVSLRQLQTFIDSMRDGSAKLDDIPYCGEAVSQLLSTCTSHTPEARGDIRTIIRRLECISADAKAQINLAYREDFPYLPIVTQLEQQVEEEF
ncbi:unnamed protein product [Caenorhabditis angaria]|uniref:Protein kinase domain-containing protein n=1 Tax=Caenorhabditis angaria TaxID=860376 RepID=A0A9P1IP04_9PELO|nr:unnamed protein product [Caenorhabditis angaria]